jgi:5-hydroxyisourate hydrolase
MTSGGNTISTHVLDTARGTPAVGVFVVLERLDDEGLPIAVGKGTTDANGRVSDLLTSGGELDAGVYRLRFATRDYFDASERETFFPEVAITFRVTRGPQHYHVPLLISPFGFTTYRGS